MPANLEKVLGLEQVRPKKLPVASFQHLDVKVEQTFVCGTERVPQKLLVEQGFHTLNYDFRKNWGLLVEHLVFKAPQNMICALKNHDKSSYQPSLFRGIAKR